MPRQTTNTTPAFFTFLRANLALDQSTISQTNTPVLEPTAIPPPTPSPRAAAPPLVPTDDIPELTLEVLTDEPSKTTALNLVADSVSQQRTRASLSLALHPLCVAGLAGSLALTFHNLQRTPALAACAALLAVYAFAAHHLTRGYRRLAAEVETTFAPHPALDTILGARQGTELIGALILRLEPSPTHTRRRGRASLRGGRGVIRAWTTAAGHRGEGVGRELLGAAVRVARERCGREAAVGFARGHANSAVVLPGLFNGGFRGRERRAGEALKAVLAGWEGKRKR